MKAHSGVQWMQLEDTCVELEAGNSRQLFADSEINNSKLAY